VPSHDLIFAVQSERMWVDVNSLIGFLRSVVEDGRAEARAAFEADQMFQYAAAMAVQDIIRQIADHLTVTEIEAQERMRSV
jgi:hypothetical protein